MMLQQLLENAHMDALGLLDPGDQAAFEKAYAGAPPAVKAVVREEQARWADSFLPDVEPSPELRERVLAAVNAAMLEAGQTAEHEHVELRGARRVPSWWRAAAVASLSVCVIVSGAFYVVFNSNQTLAQRISDDLTKEFWTTLGGQQMRDSIFSPRVAHVRFEPVQPGFEGEAVVWTHPDWDGARFYCTGLQAVSGERYQVVVLDEENVVVDDLNQPFESTAQVQTFQVPRLASGTRLGLVRVVGEARTLLMVATV